MPARLRRGLVAFLAAVPVPLPASGQGSAADGARLPGRVVDVRAGDYFFEAPDSIPMGVTTIRLAQGGREGHMLWLVRLTGGRTAQEFQRLAARHEDRPWAIDLGGPGYAAVGRSANATYDLAPGDYVLVCYVGSGRGIDSLYHVWRGMVKPLRVTGASARPVGRREQALSVDARATLTEAGVTWSTPLRAGWRRIRVENRASGWREFVIERVRPGITLADARAWRRRHGTPAPVEAVGGLATLPPGATLVTTVHLPAGNYLIKTRVSRDSGLVALRIPAARRR